MNSLKPDLASIIQDIQAHIHFLKGEGLDHIGIIEPVVHSPENSINDLEKSAHSQVQPDNDEALIRLRLKIGDCTRCKLHSSRKNLVFGEGNGQPELVLVGEGPGFDEDKTGRPFVGAAGQLLDRIIIAMGLTRSEIYICNVVKCHPPENRDPEPEEMSVCGRFLAEQLAILRPKVILCLGRISGRFLTDSPPSASLRSMRGQFYSFEGMEVRVTYHPSAVLRDPGKYKRPVWEDVQIVMERLGRPIQKQ